MKAKRILQEVGELKAIVNDDRNQIAGDFKVGIIPTLAPYLLPLFIADFIEKHPDTRLIIEELQSERIIELLENKQLDLGILATPLDEPNIKEVPVFYEPFLVYTDQENELLDFPKISNNQLKPKGLWILRKGHCFRNQTLNICDFDVSERHKNVVLEGGSIETLKKMIVEVTGYTLIPELSFNADIDSKNVINFEEPQPVREISIITHKHFTKERLLVELRKSIINHVPSHFKKNTRFVTVKWR